ncbi:unnamed protein product, partial [Symbiodinium pilosum]
EGPGRLSFRPSGESGIVATGALQEPCDTARVGSESGPPSELENGMTWGTSGRSPPAQSLDVVAPSSQQPVLSDSPVDRRWAGSGTDDGKEEIMREQSTGLRSSVVQRSGPPFQEIKQVDEIQELETDPLPVASDAETWQPPSVAVNASRVPKVTEPDALMQEQVRDTASFQASTLQSTLEHGSSPQPSTTEKAAPTGFESPSLTVNSEPASASPVDCIDSSNQSGQSWAHSTAPQPQSPALAQTPSFKTATGDPPAAEAAHARIE